MTSARVDVWADPSSGLPLRVEVFGGGRGAPAMTTSFLDFSRAEPDAPVVAFVPPHRSRVGQSRGFDLRLGHQPLLRRRSAVDRWPD